MNKAILLGLGFDCKDNQRRITLAENYRLYGGSKETHNIMKERCIKFNEQLKRRKKALHELSLNEFYDISYKVGLNVPKAARKRY